MNKKIEYTLPEWAFLDAHSHEGNPLEKRTVLLHVRSATVIEIIDRDFDDFGLNDGIISYRFKNTHEGYDEKLMAVVHYSALLNINTDREYIKENILIPCAKWYCKYCDWEDQQLHE